MLVSFSVSNYRSFSEEETFSLVASKRLSGSHESHTMPIPNSDEHVLKAAVLYGANGAGKSNLFRALQYFCSIATETLPKNKSTGRDPFAFNSREGEPSVFDMLFIADNKLYRLGFKVGNESIAEEWLIEVIGKKEKVLYERVTDEEGNVKVDARGLITTIQTEGSSVKNPKKIKALATLGGPVNQSFIASILANLNKKDYGSELAHIYNWLGTDLILISPEQSFSSLPTLLSRDSNFCDFASEFLNSSATGVSSLTVDKNEISKEELIASIPSESLDDDEKNISFRLGDGHELAVEKGDEQHYYRVKVKANHSPLEGENGSLDLSEESDGTKRLLNLMPALHLLRHGTAAFFIDEVDRSMHPMLVRKFLEFFLHSCKGDQRQIIVTTHESNLLDLELLRRDEIWFVEKDSKESTRLYSLADFKVRKDLEIRKHYLQGRFGAVPFLGNLDSLMETEQDCSK